MNILPIKSNNHYSAINKQTNHVTFKARLSNPVVEKGLIGLGTLGLATIALQKKNLQNIKTDNLLNQDSDGNTIFNKCNEELKYNWNKPYKENEKLNLVSELVLSDKDFLEINKSLSDKPEILKQLYTTPNSNGDLPAHRRMGLTKRRIMHDALKNYPEVLEQIYLTQNNNGELPIGQFFSIVSMKNLQYNSDELLDIMSALKSKPNVIAEMLNNKQINAQKSAAYWGSNDDATQKAIYIAEKFKEYPKLIEKLLLATDTCIDICNHSELFYALKDVAPDALYELYIRPRGIFWYHPKETYERDVMVMYGGVQKHTCYRELTNDEKGEIYNDIMELIMDSDLSVTKSKNLLKNQRKSDIAGYDSILKKLNEQELAEMTK